MNNELIKNLEYIERLTPEGRKDIKDYVIKLEQENKELHNKIDKVVKLRKILNNEILDTLSFDIAEEVQDLFDEILKGDKNE